MAQGLNCFFSRKDAKRRKEKYWLSQVSAIANTVFKCIIPKGTRYYSNEQDTPINDIEIVSECIILKEIVNFG